MAAPPGSAIVQGLIDQVRRHWNEFAARDGTCLLVFRVDHGEYQVIDTFVTLQGEDMADATDVFVGLDQRCEDAETYVAGAVVQLRDRYEEAERGLQEAGERGLGPWKPPERVEGVAPVAYLAAACSSFARHIVTRAPSAGGRQASDMRCVFWLQPSAFVAIEWARLLAELVKTDLPPIIRFLTTDAKQEPALVDLATKHPDRVTVIDPELDMPQAIRELAHGSGGSGPGFQFRIAMVDLMQLAETSDLKDPDELRRFELAAERVRALAAAQGWPQHEFVVHMLVGGGLVGAQRFDAGIERYRDAAAAASRAMAAGEATGKTLLTQARFGEGAAQVMRKDFVAAAEVYQHAAEAARASESADLPLLEIEAWRMRGLCAHQASKLEDAWGAYDVALKAAEQRLVPQMRPATSLVYVGRGMLALCEPQGPLLLGLLRRRSPYADRKDEVERRMLLLLGEDWQEGGNP